MTRNPSVRIVWYEGKAYPVSNTSPSFHTDTGWYVLLPDGWYQVAECGAPDVDTAWEDVESCVLEWLAGHVPRTSDVKAADAAARTNASERSTDRPIP